MFLWDYLRQSNKKKVLYGVGNGAEKILALCEKYNVEISGVFSSDDRQKNRDFFGFPVLSFDKAMKKFDHPIVLLAFGTELESVISHIKDIESQCELYAPDLPVSSGPLIDEDFIKAHECEIAAARCLLSDERSLMVFDNLIKYKLSGKLSFLFDCESPISEKKDILNLKGNEHFLDLGAYTGDTIDEFLKLTNGCYSHITALEANEKNFRKLAEHCSGLNNITLINKASWYENTYIDFCGKDGRNFALLTDIPGKKKKIRSIETISIDSLNISPDFVKMDVEGAENESIAGMKNTIVKFRPSLQISVYHRTDDFIRIPLLLAGICPGYRMYLRHHPSLPAWELQLYCIYDNAAVNELQLNG